MYDHYGIGVFGLRNWGEIYKYPLFHSKVYPCKYSWGYILHVLGVILNSTVNKRFTPNSIVDSTPFHSENVTIPMFCMRGVDFGHHLDDIRSIRKRQIG